MAERHPLRNPQVMREIRDVHSFFRKEGLRVKNNQPIVPHTAIS